MAIIAVVIYLLYKKYKSPKSQKSRTSLASQESQKIPMGQKRDKYPYDKSGDDSTVSQSTRSFATNINNISV